MCPWWTQGGALFILFGFYKKDDAVRIENAEDSFYSLRYGAPAVVVVDVEAARNKCEVVKVGCIDADGVQLCPRIDAVGGFAVTRAGWNKSGEFVAANFGGNGSTGAVDGYILTSDFANVERKIDVVNNGLCDGFYAQAQLVNGVQNAMQQGFMSAEISRANQQAAFMQQLNAMQMQQANCCCETREAIQGVNYNLATQACDTRQTIQNGTRDIIENQNANARAVLDALTAQRIEAKDAKIAEQNQQLFAAQLAASQAAQNETLKAYMSGQLAYYNPRPVPAFPVPAPYQYGNCGTCNGCGC